MTNRIFASLALAAASFAVPPRLTAQGPNGTDINKAIPIYFGQTITDIGDGATNPIQVYSIALSKGQSVTLLASKLAGGNSGGTWTLSLLRPGVTTVKALQSADVLACRGHYCNDGSNTAQAQTFTYLVSASGLYYAFLQFDSNGMNYSFVTTAQGTPIAVPNPPTAGCLSGRVDYLTYSLQFIAAGLADEVSIGSQRACPSCTVKAPLYPEIVTRLENALRSKVNVEACYDSTGNIFQIKLVTL